MKFKPKINKMKKIMSVILPLLMLLVILASCKTPSESNQNNDSGDDSNTVENSDSADTQNQETTEEEKMYPDLPAQDFGGYEFTFLTRTINSPDWVEWDHRDISATEENGDVINDAVYVRNQKIEEKYNIKIKEIVVENPQVETLVTKAVKAGDDIYDVVCPHVTQFPPTAQNGYYVDLFTVPNLDLTKPWWDQGCVRDLSIINKLFIIEGDLLILDNDAMEAMIFNKSMLQDNALESPYEIVKRGDWTFSKLLEMSRSVSKDLNGDGEMYIQDDAFGCILQADSIASFIVSGGEKICAKDTATDYPIITFGSERCYQITDAIAEMMADNDHFVHLHRYENKFPIYDEQVKMFSENRALFSWIRMRIVERLRGMETDFGIIPLPKLDSAQENYVTPNNPHTGAGISIPVSASDLARTGTILEDLAAESRYTLQPAYYEINLRGKYARDVESQEMLDIILNNTAFDIGYIYDFGGFGSVLVNYGRSDKIPNYVSDFEKYQPKIQTAIDKTASIYEELGQ